GYLQHIADAVDNRDRRRSAEGGGLVDRLDDDCSDVALGQVHGRRGCWRRSRLRSRRWSGLRGRRDLIAATPAASATAAGCGRTQDNEHGNRHLAQRVRKQVSPERRIHFWAIIVRTPNFTPAGIR